MIRRCRISTIPRPELLDQRLLLSTLTPAQIDSAYGLNAITFSNGTVKGNGAGQTIAIIDAYHDPSIYGDLVAFDARNGLPNPYLTPSLPAGGLSGSGQAAFSMVNFAGASTNSTWNAEEALDVEMAHAVAPAANIVLVEAKSTAIYDFLTAITAIKTLPSVSVISMSWGGSEFYGQQSFDSVFTTPPGHRGITFLASSGDNGAGDQWPASSPNVVGVGGTSLVVTSAGARASESAWSGSGGGTSQIEPKPSYQSQAVSGSSRSTPDVAIDADPGSGVVINTWGNQLQVGGTSLSSPLWAGLIAIADQGLVVAGRPTLDGATQTLPDLYKAPSGSFYDVTTGNRATPGYDTSTGLGSPNAATLVRFLDGATTSTTVTGGGGATTTGVGGTKTTGGGATTSTSANLSDLAPAPTSPLLGSSWGNPSLVANVAPVPSPTSSIDPGAADDVLERWDLGRSVLSSLLTGRLKPRG
jgi:subtilase family serine protease